MAAKTLLPNQHTPLHFIYGHSDCCLCVAESKIQELQTRLSNAKLQLRFAMENRNRFQNHLDTIVSALGIPWWDGDFPIDEVLEKIGKGQ